MWVEIVFSNRLIVLFVSAEIIMRLAVFGNSIFLSLLPINRHTRLAVSELIIRIGCRIIDCRCKTHWKVSDSHVLNLTNMCRFLLFEFISRKCNTSRCFFEEDRILWISTETKVRVSWCFLKLCDLSLRLGYVFNINGSRSLRWHV